jgi:hypothetical protein
MPNTNQTNSSSTMTIDDSSAHAHHDNYNELDLTVESVSKHYPQHFNISQPLASNEIADSNSQKTTLNTNPSEGIFSC